MLVPAGFLCLFHPFTSIISVVILITVAIQVLWCKFEEFGIGLTIIPLIDDFEWMNENFINMSKFLVVDLLIGDT